MKVVKKFLPLIVAGMALAILVPLVGAYEAHVVDVRAHVKGQPFTKTMRLAEPSDWEGMGIAFPNPPNGDDPGTAEYDPVVTDPNSVPEKTCVVWVVTISVPNTEGYTMQRVTVRDNFNAEVAIAVMDFSHGTVNIVVKPNQYSVNVWEFFNFAPGETAELELLVWTKLNKGDKQEFTSTGPHWINESGVTMKWYEWVCKGSSNCRWKVSGSMSTGPRLPVTVY